MKADVLALLRESPGAWLSVAQMERELPQYSAGQVRVAVRRLLIDGLVEQRATRQRRYGTLLMVYRAREGGIHGDR